jgi:hypothetical protein
MLYALCRRLAEKRPLIWLYKEVYYLFLTEGVYELPERFQRAYFRSIVWALIDSEESPSGVPQGLASLGTRVFTIYATSPASEQWKRLHKSLNEKVVIMNPWTREEIHRA